MARNRRTEIRAIANLIGNAFAHFVLYQDNAGIKELTRYQLQARRLLALRT